MADSGVIGPAPPGNRPHGGVEDLQAHFAEITAKVPVDESFREAFVQSKLLLAHTHPTFDLAARDLAVNNLVDRLGTYSWGPIVETFQSAYAQTKPMGALATQLVTADNSGNWGSWALLDTSAATVRTDNVGFHLLFLDPNYAFAVNS